MHSGSPTEPPRRDTHTLNSHSSDARVENLGKGSWLEDQLESQGYQSEFPHALNQLGTKADSQSWLDLLIASVSPRGTGLKPHRERKAVEGQESPTALDHGTFEMPGKASSDYQHTHHRAQDHLFDEFSKPALNGYDHHTISSAHSSPLPTDPDHAITATGSLVRDASTYEDAHSMPYIQPSFPPSIPADGAHRSLHDDVFHSTSPYDSVTRLGGESEAQNGYTYGPPIFSNAPHTQLSQSSSGHHFPAEHLAGFSDSELDRLLERIHNRDFTTSLPSPTFHNVPNPIAHDIPFQPSFPPVISSDSFNHITHDTPQITHPAFSRLEPTQRLERPSNL